jgi:lipid-A-disaccharide synthase
MLRTDTVTLVNLVSETRVVPEFIGKACRPELIADALRQVRSEPQAQLEALDLTMDRLGRGQEAPGLRAARAVLNRL